MRRETTSGPASDLSRAHIVNFYDDDGQLAISVAQYLADGLRNGEMVIAIATSSHQAAIAQELAAMGFDVALARASGRLTILDAHETLRTFMRGGVLNAALFEENVGATLEKLAAAKGRRVRAYGEMVDVLWQSGNRPAALQLEECWNTLQDRIPFALLCAYRLAEFRREPGEMDRVCSTHTHVNSSGVYQETLGRGRVEQLYRFAQAVMSAERLEDVFEAALTSIDAATQTTRSSILLFDESDRMRFRAWHNLSDTYRAAVDGHSPWSPDATDVAPVLIGDALNDPAMAPYEEIFRAEGIAALAFVPLVTNGRLIGKLMVYHDRPHVYSPPEVETASAIANHLASVVRRFSLVAQLEETVRTNDLFAAILAHDLRNPLSAITMSAQVLLLQRSAGHVPSATEEVKLLERIVNSGQRMGHMIQQLLDATRARSGDGIKLDATELDLAELCAQARAELQAAHPQWAIETKVRGNTNGFWDSHRLMQVVSNLLSNAGQHGTAGAPVVVTVDGSRADSVVLTVHNRGAIDPQLLPRIFDPFRRSAQAQTTSTGLGLGLFIVREIVQSHGGDVSAFSTPAEGTTMVVRLPRRAGDGSGDMRRHVVSRRFESTQA